MLSFSAAARTRSPAVYLAISACSVEFWSSSVLWVATAREIPVFIRSSETCMKTIPPSMIPITQMQARPRRRRSTSRWSGTRASRSNGPVRPRTGGPTGTGRRTGPETRRGWTGAVRGRVAVACLAMTHLGELPCGPQASRLRTGIGRDLARRGDDRTAVDELGLRRVAAHADGELGRADAAAGAVGEEALDAAVLERVEGERGEAAADLEDAPGER